MVRIFSNPLDEEQTEDLTQAFFRDGCVIISRVLTPAETAALRAKTDEYAAKPATPAKHISYTHSTLLMRRCHEMDPLLQNMTVHLQNRKVVEAALGPHARFNACNVLRNETGQAISRWHVDDVVEFPYGHRFHRSIRASKCLCSG